MDDDGDELHLSAIEGSLSAHDPVVLPRTSSHAAVAMVLSGDVDPRVLFMERAQRDGDPWSGQMAFPGGRYEEQDSDLLETAVRETWEEVGLELDVRQQIGRLDDQSGRRAGRSSDLVISNFVFKIDHRPQLTLNEEVASVHWVPMSKLLHPEHRIDYRFPKYPSAPFPGIVVGDQHHVVWGLTFRMLETFFRILEVDF